MAPRRGDGSTAGDLLAFSDDQLAEILIRLPSLADLGRACCACPDFRRVITGHSFLRRLRALHPAPLLGILTNAFIPAQPPHPSAAAASTFADTADFGCSFLPSRDRWRCRGERDGRVLFSAIPEGSDDKGFNAGALVRDLAVCDPIHRRYLLLPAISDELAALVPQQELVGFEPFLAPACEDDEGGYLLLQGIPEDFILFPSSERPNLDCFSLNLKSFKLEWFCQTKHGIFLADLYAGFPLSLSPPTI